MNQLEKDIAVYIGTILGRRWFEQQRQNSSASMNPTASPKGRKKKTKKS